MEAQAGLPRETLLSLRLVLRAAVLADLRRAILVLSFRPGLQVGARVGLRLATPARQFRLGHRAAVLADLRRAILVQSSRPGLQVGARVGLRLAIPARQFRLGQRAEARAVPRRVTPARQFQPALQAVCLVRLRELVVLQAVRQALQRDQPAEFRVHHRVRAARAAQPGLLGASPVHLLAWVACRQPRLAVRRCLAPLLALVGLRSLRLRHRSIRVELPPCLLPRHRVDCPVARVRHRPVEQLLRAVCRRHRVRPPVVRLLQAACR